MQVVERRIASVARRQDNVVALAQLLEAGLGRGAISHRVESRAMQRLHRGVYLIGAAPPTQMGRAWAAVLACGAGAVISHRSAAELYGLLPGARPDVDITVVGRNPGAEPGIRLHRPRALRPVDVVTMRGMPITSLARTVCDLAATEPPREVERAFQEALYREIVAPGQLAAVLAREPGRRGAPVIRGLIDEPRMTRSDKERALLKLIDAAQLPRPVTNVRVHGYLADAYWPAHKVVVEFDGWRAHGHRHAFESNRKRDQVLLAHGIRSLRVTDRQLEREPVAVAARIAMTLNN